MDGKLYPVHCSDFKYVLVYLYECKFDLTPQEVNTLAYDYVFSGMLFCDKNIEAYARMRVTE